MALPPFSEVGLVSIVVSTIFLNDQTKLVDSTRDEANECGLGPKASSRESGQFGTPALTALLTCYRNKA